MKPIKPLITRNQIRSFISSLSAGATVGIYLYLENTTAPYVITAALATIIITAVAFRLLKGWLNPDFYQSTTTLQENPPPILPQVEPIQRAVQRRSTKTIQKINPDYYKPETALQRFTATSSTVIIGVGCAGINGLDYMVESGLQSVDTIAIDTDLQTLHRSTANCSLFIGDKKEDVKVLASAALHQLQSVYDAAECVVVLVGMGGRTGTVVAPLIARDAKQKGKAAHMLAMEPSSVEGRANTEKSAAVLDGLRDDLDSAVSLSNDDLSKVFTDGARLSESFSKANEVWRRLVADVAQPAVMVH